MRNSLPRFADSLASGVLGDRFNGPALDTIVYTGTAIGATLAAGTIATGDSFQIRNTNGGTPADLVQAWSDHQVAGIVRVRSPKFHDNVDAIRWRAQIGVLDPQLPWGA